MANRAGISTAVSRRSSPNRSRMRAFAVGIGGTWKRNRRRSASRCGVIRTGYVAPPSTLRNASHSSVSGSPPKIRQRCPLDLGRRVGRRAQLLPMAPRGERALSSLARNLLGPAREEPEQAGLGRPRGGNAFRGVSIYFPRAAFKSIWYQVPRLRLCQLLYSRVQTT